MKAPTWKKTEYLLKSLDARVETNDIPSDEERQIHTVPNARQHELSPFRRLPDDIIREIFVACLPPQY